MKIGRCTALRLVRTACDLRLVDVERATGIGQSLLARIEKGDAGVTAAQLGKLAAFYQVEVGVLSGRVPFSTLAMPPVIVS